LKQHSNISAKSREIGRGADILCPLGELAIRTKHSSAAAAATAAAAAGSQTHVSEHLHETRILSQTATRKPLFFVPLLPTATQKDLVSQVLWLHQTPLIFAPHQRSALEGFFAYSVGVCFFSHVPQYDWRMDVRWKKPFLF
jgi:hypothetical protein